MDLLTSCAKFGDLTLKYASDIDRSPLKDGAKWDTHICQIWRSYLDLFKTYWKFGDLTLMSIRDLDLVKSYSKFSDLTLKYGSGLEKSPLKKMQLNEIHMNAKYKDPI